MPDYNYLFLSDLHLSEGRDPATGKLSRNEDFFYDEAFARFIVYHNGLNHRATAHYQRPWKLIINGDIFDFLQVTSLPAEGDALEAVTGHRFYHQLRENERRYGLGTSSKETVWKLGRIKAGHALFFRTLGWFLAHEGNTLILLKGNHDVELFWPAVQDEMRRLIAEAYGEWWADQAENTRPDSPLPLQDGLPPALNAEALAQHVQFPIWFHYEPGLFYVEHGNQYDPTNAFPNFIEPILEEDRDRPPDKQRVELPSGSFFVRYFFNKVEQVHPFADNIKPLSRYMRWTLRKQPIATLRMLISNADVLPNTIRNLISKDAIEMQMLPQQERRTKAWPAAGLFPLDDDRCQALLQIQHEHRKQAGESSSGVALGTGGGMLLNGVLGYFLMRTMRHFVDRRYLRMGGSFLLANLSFIGGTLLSRKLDNLDYYVSLPEAAHKICGMLNRPGADGTPAGVRYHIFGHDHHANMVELRDDSPHNPGHRQWYINTGCWLPTLDEQARLTRGDVQFTFFRLVPGLHDQDDVLPQLLEWNPERDEARPVRLFDNTDTHTTPSPEIRK